MKTLIRTELLKKRNNLSGNDKLNFSLKIKGTLVNLPEYKKAKAILCYMPINNEVDTVTLIKDSLKNKKRIALPKVNKKEHSIEVFEIKNIEGDLEIGCYNILEPKIENKRLNYSDIDLILVPGVAFDCRGFRIGYGKGYYDRLLKNTNAAKIALAYEFQVHDKLPGESHDVCVDKIITEKRIIECGGELK